MTLGFVAMALAGSGRGSHSGLPAMRSGAKRVLVFGLLAQAVAALGYLLAHELAAFYAVAALFGFLYAGVMPLYAVIIRENFPRRMMGIGAFLISMTFKPFAKERAGAVTA